MNESKISVRYSKALLQFALEKKKLDPVYQDMLQLYQICQQVDELISIFHNPIIPQSRKKKIIRAVFSDKVTDITLSFLEMVMHNKREIYIPDISRRFLDDYKRYKKITTVILTTVIPLDQQLKERIIQLVRNAYHTTVELEENQSEQLIGGFIIRMDDLMLDASVSKVLKKMRKKLITKEFEHR